MFQRQDIEKLLRLNGVSLDDSEDEIKSVLISAQWHKDDVEAAVMVLSENPNDHKTHIDSLHKVFRSDERLRPETISSLLGIDMNITSKEIEQRKRQANGNMQPSQILTVAVMALMLSLIFVFASMRYLEMGLFHKTLI
jgi:hypothetical protein